MRLAESGLLESAKHSADLSHVLLHCALVESEFKQFYVDILKWLCTNCAPPSAQTSLLLALSKPQNRKFSLSFKIEFSKLIKNKQTIEPEKLNLISVYLSKFLAICPQFSLSDILGS